MNLDGKQKSILILKNLNSKISHKVLNYLTTLEIKKILEKTLILKKISNNSLNTVIKEFNDIYKKKISKENAVQSEFLKIFSKKNKNLFFDKQKILKTYSKTTEPMNETNQTKNLTPKEISSSIKEEDPKIIAIILSNLEIKTACETLCLIDDNKKKSEILLNLAYFNGLPLTSQDEFKNLAKKLLKKNILNLTFEKKGGIKKAARILELIPIKHETIIINNILEIDTNIAKKILHSMFLFENFVNLTDEVIKKLIKEVSIKSLFISLNNSEPSIKKKFLMHFSKKEIQKFQIYNSKHTHIELKKIKNEQKKILQIFLNMNK